MNIKKREKVFRFKQFSVRNDLSAMKVGTDGVLLGAWADVAHASSVLDVGTGTGLVALMVAQRCDAEITGVEIEAEAVLEAGQNFAESSWKNRLKIVHADFIEYSRECKERFDVIVSNPPYFVNSLECPDEKRTQARHTDSLSYDKLIECSARLLTENGKIFLITPSDVENLLEKIVEDCGLHVNVKTYICPTVGSAPKRILWKLSHENKECDKSSITIEKSRHVYTDEYIALTREYYLNM